MKRIRKEIGKQFQNFPQNMSTEKGKSTGEATISVNSMSGQKYKSTGEAS